MNTQANRRARTLAFALGGLSVVIELAMLVGLSHAQAPEGQFLAGQAGCAPQAVIESSPVILMRKRELSL